MAFKIVLLCSVLVYANAGLLSAPAISTYAAAPALAYHAAPAISTYAAPAISTYAAPAFGTHPAPAISTYAGPAINTYAAPAISTYAAPAISSYAAPAISSYAAPAVSSYAAPAISSYAAPAFSAYAAPAISYSTPTLSSHSSNIYRSFGNLGQISTYSKTVQTPFSSVRKSDVRVSNPGIRIASAPAYAPVLSYSAPAIPQAAPLGLAYSAAPAYSALGYGSAYGKYVL